MSSTTTRRNGVSAAAPAARVPHEKAKDSSRAFNIGAAIVLTVFAVLWLIPSLFALKTSLGSNSTAALGAPGVLSDYSITFGSYIALFQAGDIWNWYLSSFITATVATVLTVVFASMGGYALSRLRFPGRNWVFLLMILGIMVPAQVLVVPTFQMLDAAGLLNTYWAVIFPQVPAVIALFVFKQFFDGLPKELEEAARIDGAGYWRIYRQVIMPLSGPVIAAMAIVTFVGVWNNLILPLFVVSNPELMTIPVGLATVQGSFGQRFADIQASAVLGALPLVILYMIFQRRIIEGVAGTGLKG
ncbi:carbohydrate ABC transporter permease [Quadrisphaera sp. KR29]|uniref:carbohydrate ABC transporter permease n=1 Tax=Quadrisphaera sp. KR29 TaxID=3461391 RepID=UPI004043D411